MAAQFWECTKNHLIAPSKGVDFTTCELFYNKAVIFKKSVLRVHFFSMYLLRAYHILGTGNTTIPRHRLSSRFTVLWRKPRFKSWLTTSYKLESILLPHVQTGLKAGDWQTGRAC